MGSSSSERSVNVGRPIVHADRAWSRWYTLALMLMVSILSATDRLVISVVAEPLRHEFGLSDSDIGFLSGMAFSLTFALAALPMGHLLDRYSRRVILGGIIGIWSGLTALGGLAQGYSTLVLARLGVGAAEAGGGPGALSWVADTFPREKRSTAVGIYYSGAAFGLLLSFLGGSWLLHHFGWRAVFLLAGTPGIIVALLILFTLKEPVRGAHDDLEAGSHDGKIGMVAALISIIKNKPLVLVILATTISSGTQYSITTWMTSFMTRVHHVPVEQAAGMNGLAMGVSMAIGSLASGPITDLITRGEPGRVGWVAAIFTLAALASGMAFVAAPSAQGALIWLGILSIFMGSYLGVGSSMMVSLAAPRIRNSTIAVTKLTMILVGQGTIPFFTGALSDFVGGDFSLRPALYATVSLYAIAAIGFIMAGQAIRSELRTRGNLDPA